MMDPLKHNALLEEIQTAIRETGNYQAEVDRTGKAEIDEVTTFATSQYRPDQGLDVRARQVADSRWVVTVSDPYRPEGA